MGKMVKEIALLRNHLVADKGDVCIDFSRANAVIPHLKKCLKNKTPLVIGTTGWEKEIPFAKKLVEEEGGTALFAPNFSLGVAYFLKLIENGIKLFPHAERVGLETHHSEKQDAPSGTAKNIETKFNIPFSSLRIGSVTGKHEVIFETEYEQITLTHAAKNREGFALGAVCVAEWILNQKGWLTLDDYLHSTDHSL